MRCRACNCILAPDDDPEMCAECLGSARIERNAPIADEYTDLVDHIEWVDRARESDVLDAILDEGRDDDVAEEE